MTAANHRAAGRGPRARAAPAQARRDAPRRPRAAASPRRPNAGHRRSCSAHWSRPRSPPATPATPGSARSRPLPDPSRPSTSSTSPRAASRRRPGPTSPRWSGSAPTENLTLVGPAGTGKSHTLIALGHAAVDAGHRVRYFTAADLVETLYRGLADNSVGRRHRDHPAQRPDHRRRGRLRPPGRHRRPAAVPVRRRRLRTPQPRHRQPLALRAMGPVPARTHHRRQPARPAPAPRQRRRHRRRVLPHARSPHPEEDAPRSANHHARVGTFTWPPAGTATWPLTAFRIQFASIFPAPKLPRGAGLLRGTATSPGP